MVKKNKILLVVFFIFLIYFLIRNIQSSVFLKKKDRVNVVFYGQNSLYYSLGSQDVNYLLSLPADVEVLIPGGYGYYRLGALGKLVSLEKKPDIYKITFSSLTSSFVDLYFYPPVSKIYYDGVKESASSFPSFIDIFLDKSNGNILDLIIVSFSFLNKNSNQYKIITDFSMKREQGKAIFDQVEFFKKNQGFFYKKTYRNIKDNVQILYTKSYKTAQLISQIIEGEGIRIVDITQIPNSKFQNPNLKSCLIIENNKKPSVVAYDLQKFFGCGFRRGETEVSDIILVLGNLEKEWEVD